MDISESNRNIESNEGADDIGAIRERTLDSEEASTQQQQQQISSTTNTQQELQHQQQIGNKQFRVKNNEDLIDLEPKLSYRPPYEPMSSTTAPQVMKSKFPRMVVDVDAFMETDNEGDSSKSLTAVSSLNNSKVFDIMHDLSRDKEVPSVTSTPQRSTSQDAAIKAVLGNDFDCGNDDLFYVKKVAADSACESTAGQTADLSEDEIVAIVPPELRRTNLSSNSSPGAYSVSASGGHISLTPSRAESSSRRLYTLEDENHEVMVSATLVDADVFNASDLSHDGPILVYAERLWWKRRFVLCVSAWMLLALAVVTVSVTLALRLTMDSEEISSLENDQPNDVNTTIGSVKQTLSPMTSLASNSPTKSPIDTNGPTLASAAPSILATYSSGTRASMGTCFELC
jgi:hypothetical protein